MAPGSDRLHQQDAASSSEPSAAPPPTPYPTAGPAPGPQPGPDARQASSAGDHTSISGQGQVDRSGGDSSEASTGASSQQLQGDSPKARWSQVSISTLHIAVEQSRVLLLANQTFVIRLKTLLCAEVVSWQLMSDRMPCNPQPCCSTVSGMLRFAVSILCAR